MEYTKILNESFDRAAAYSRKCKQQYIYPEHLFLGIIDCDEVLEGLDLVDTFAGKRDQIFKFIKENSDPEGKLPPKGKERISSELDAVMDNSEDIARQLGVPKVNCETTLLSIVEKKNEWVNFALEKSGVNVEMLVRKILRNMVASNAEAKKEFFAGRVGTPAGRKGGPDGRTEKGENILNKYCKDLTKDAYEGKLDPVYGRDDETLRVIQILSRRRKNNPVILGEPGVGKTAVVEGLALRIVQGNVPFNLENKRILSLDLAAMVAGTTYRGQFEERIKKTIEYVAQSGDIILFLDELHTLMGAGAGSDDKLDAANILKPALSRGEIQLIGATTLSEYRKFIEKDGALERRFMTVNLEEPTAEETIKIIKTLAPKYERFHKVVITDEAIESAVRLSGRYINERKFPDKAIDVIDEACSLVHLAKVPYTKTKEYYDKLDELDQGIEDAIFSGDYAKAGALKKEMDKTYDGLVALDKKFEKNDKSVEILPAHIEKVVSTWCKIPISKLVEKESDKLLRLEKELHKRVVGQDKPIEALSKAIRRGKTGLGDPNRPIGSFLFLGPTGVGKTELSKALAEVLFGDEKALIRFDMSEYMEPHAVAKLIGSPPGYVGHDEGGQLTDRIRTNPYSVVLFDEVEKGHPDVMNILLQILDDGQLTDSKGVKVSFKDAVIIMTSNIGAARIVEPKLLGFGAESTPDSNYENMKSKVMEELKKTFRPEFINRIDEISVFKQLTRKEIVSIAGLLLKKVSIRAKENMEINITFSQKLKEFIADTCSDAKMGARPIRRGIQTNVDDELSQEFLSGHIKRGDDVLCTVEKEKVIFKVKSPKKKEG